MSRLEIRVDGKDVEAAKMLSTATLILRMLKSVERQVAKERGIKNRIPWRIDMQSGSKYGLIAVRAEGDSASGWEQEITSEVKARLRGA